MNAKIRSAEIVRNSSGEVEFVKLIFGSHFYVVVDATAEQGVSFTLGATHHGITVDATNVDGELTNIINSIRATHATLASDSIPGYKA